MKRASEVRAGEYLGFNNANYLRNRKIRADGFNSGALSLFVGDGDEHIFNEKTINVERDILVERDTFVFVAQFSLFDRKDKYGITTWAANKGIELKLMGWEIFAKIQPGYMFESYMLYAGDEILKRKVK